jgi:hypothetical protein
MRKKSELEAEVRCTTYSGEKYIYVYEGSQAVPDRPSGKDMLKRR